MAQQTLKPAALATCLSLAMPALADKDVNPFDLQALPRGYLISQAAKDTQPSGPQKTDKDTEGTQNSGSSAPPKTPQAKCGEAKCSGKR